MDAVAVENVATGAPVPRSSLRGSEGLAGRPPGDGMSGRPAAPGRRLPWAAGLRPRTGVPVRCGCARLADGQPRRVRGAPAREGESPEPPLAARGDLNRSLTPHALSLFSGGPWDRGNPCRRRPGRAGGGRGSGPSEGGGRRSGPVVLEGRGPVGRGSNGSDRSCRAGRRWPRPERPRAEGARLGSGCPRGSGGSCSRGRLGPVGARVGGSGPLVLGGVGGGRGGQEGMGRGPDVAPGVAGPRIGCARGSTSGGSRRRGRGWCAGRCRPAGAPRTARARRARASGRRGFARRSASVRRRRP